jgi:signal transduction histidine kinase
LFGRFFRGRNAQNIQGTGLGLNIVAKYLEILGGTITFKSVLEEGTTFTLSIPTNNTEEL